jgi:phosphoenolpyruvate carboxykinase (GTP)
VPSVGAIDTSGLDLPEDALPQLLAVDTDEWREQLPQMREHLASFGEKLPDKLGAELDKLEKRLEGSS